MEKKTQLYKNQRAIQDRIRERMLNVSVLSAAPVRDTIMTRNGPTPWHGSGS